MLTAVEAEVRGRGGRGCLDGWRQSLQAQDTVVVGGRAATAAHVVHWQSGCSKGAGNNEERQERAALGDQETKGGDQRARLQGETGRASEVFVAARKAEVSKPVRRRQLTGGLMGCKAHLVCFQREADRGALAAMEVEAVAMGVEVGARCVHKE